MILSFAAGMGKTNASIPDVTGIDLPNGASVKDASGAAANLSIARSGLQFDKRATPGYHGTIKNDHPRLLHVSSQSPQSGRSCTRL
jgi:hypothetical protein